MSKTRKRIAAGILAALMTLSVTGCNQTENQPADTNATQGGTAEPGNTAAPDNTANTDNGGSDNPSEGDIVNGIDVSEIRSAASTDAEEASDLADIIPKETLTLDVYSQLANYSGKQLGWFAEVIKEKFNVELNIINNPEGTFATRMESKNLGDIVVFGGYDDYKDAANAGLLLDWEDDELAKDYAPFVWNNLKPALIKNKTLAGSDGKLHGFGHDVALSSGDIKAYDYWPALRFDLYQEIGAPKIKTLEDYIPVFDQMKKVCPTADNGEETYAVSLFYDWDGDMVMYVKALAAIYGWEEFGFGLYDVNNDVYEDALKKDGMYLRCLKWYNTLYQKGLLDPNSMTQPEGEQSAAQAAGQAFFDLFSWRGPTNYNTEDHLNAGKAMYAVPPADAKNLVYGQGVYGQERMWTVGANTQYPELCLAIINWLSTPDGYMVTYYEPKGETWDYNSDGKAYLTELGLKAQTDKKTTEVRGSSFEDGEFKINNTTLVKDCTNPKTGESFNSDNWSTKPDKEPAAILKAWQDWSGYENANEYLAAKGYKSVVPQTLYASTDKGDLTDTWEQVKKCITSESWNAVYAKDDAEFDKTVDGMIQKANEYGYQKCVEFQQNEAALRKAAVEAAKADVQ